MWYSLAYTGILLIILAWKIYRLIKNQRNYGDYEMIDTTFIDKLNETEGDSI